MGVEACRIILLFFAYSFLGWCCECIYCSIPAGHFINRGFLNGPVCPVYGFGALAVLGCLTPLSGSLPLVFLCGMVVTSVLEYITGWLLETLFHTKWWDYSGHRFQLHGRVCLLNSTLFGLLGVVLLYGIHPLVRGWLSQFSLVTMVWWASSCTTLLAVDLYLSVRTALQVSGKLQEMEKIFAQARGHAEAAVSQGRLQFELFRGLSPAEKLDAILGSAEGARLRGKLESLGRTNLMHRRLLDAFPTMRLPHGEDSCRTFREAVRRFREERRQREHKANK